MRHVGRFVGYLSQLYHDFFCLGLVSQSHRSLGGFVDSELHVNHMFRVKNVKWSKTFRNTLNSTRMLFLEC